jgi:hypothetical protein
LGLALPVARTGMTPVVSNRMVSLLTACRKLPL